MTDVNHYFGKLIGTLLSSSKPFYFVYFQISQGCRSVSYSQTTWDVKVKILNCYVLFVSDLHFILTSSILESKLLQLLISKLFHSILIILENILNKYEWLVQDYIIYYNILVYIFTNVNNREYKLKHLLSEYFYVDMSWSLQCVFLPCQLLIILIHIWGTSRNSVHFLSFIISITLHSNGVICLTYISKVELEGIFY